MQILGPSARTRPTAVKIPTELGLALLVQRHSSNTASCLFDACFVVSGITIIRYSIRHVRRRTSLDE